MTRLGFLLGDKVSEGPAGTQYSMEEPEARQVTAPLMKLDFLSFHVLSELLLYFPDKSHHDHEFSCPFIIVYVI